MEEIILYDTGRSTVDVILALRLLSELLREVDRPLNMAYLDIKAAFDSVDLEALLKVLRSMGNWAYQSFSYG